MPYSGCSTNPFLSLISLETSLLGSSRSPKVRALAWQVLTQAGVASRSMPGLRPFSRPASMRSMQKLHFTVVPTVCG